MSTNYSNMFDTPRDDEQYNIQTQQIASTSNYANASLVGAPSTASQTSVASHTYAQAPAHQVQGNTNVYQYQFSHADNDTLISSLADVPSRFVNPQGFSSVQSEQSNPLSFQTATISVAIASGVAVSDTSHPISQVGSSSSSYSGSQGSKISTPSTSAYAYALN